MKTNPKHPRSHFYILPTKTYIFLLKRIDKSFVFVLKSFFDEKNKMEMKRKGEDAGT